MKTIQSVQILGLVLCAASAAHAQTAPPPSSGGPLPALPPSGPATPPPPPTTAPAPPQYAPPTAAPLPPLPGGAPVYVDYAQPVPSRMSSGYEGKFMLGLAWDIAIPVGSVHDFTANVSPVGFQILGEYWVTRQLAIGAALDWQTYWDTRPRNTYQVENGALTATPDNSVQNGSARTITRYYFMDEGKALPYAGVNIGIGWTTFQSAAADLAFYDNTLSVLLGAELGVAIAPSPRGPLFNVGVRYAYLPTADFLSVNNIQSVDFLIGVMMH